MASSIKNWFFISIFVLSFAVILNDFYLFYITKNYIVTVEAKCNPDEQSCFIRDCTNPDDCPPNQFSVYRIFDINAADFEQCRDDTCLNECITDQITCKEIKCGESEEDTCSIFINQTIGSEENVNNS